MSKCSWTTFLAALALVAAGCGSDSNAPDGTGGSPGAGGDVGSGGSGGEIGTGGTGGDPGTGGTGGSQQQIPDGPDTGWVPEPPVGLNNPMLEIPRADWCPETYAWWSSVRGWAVAPGGRPLAGAYAQLCIYAVEPVEGGIEEHYVCLNPAQADDEGVFTIEPPAPLGPVDQDFRCISEAALRVRVPRSGRATTYCTVEPDGEVARRIAEPMVVPQVPPAIDLPPEGDAKAWREVVFEDGLRMQVLPDTFFPLSDGYADLGARRVPTDAVGLCGEAPDFDGLFAFHPEASVREAPGFAVSFPNEEGWPAGSAVELFVLGGIRCTLFGETDHVPEGTWAKFGEGRVSADGTRIESAEGAGLPCLTWMAYRLKE